MLFIMSSFHTLTNCRAHRSQHGATIGYSYGDDVGGSSYGAGLEGDKDQEEKAFSSESDYGKSPYNIHSYMHRYMHRYIHAYIHTCTRAYIHTCIHT